jgi:hypothetical protein
LSRAGLGSVSVESSHVEATVEETLAQAWEAIPTRDALRRVAKP